jgi:hypothetical protein
MNMPKFVAPAAVYEFADRIREEMKNSNKSWKVVARILCEAQERFNQQPDAFKAVAKSVNLSRPSVVKLIAIAQDERLDRHSDYFDQCAAWSVLYQITTLDDEQFAELIALLDSQQTLDGRAPAVNTALVNRVKNKETKPANPYKLAFELRIDADALLTEEFSAEEFERLCALVNEVANSVPFVQIVKHDVFENEYEKRTNAIVREENRETMKYAKKAIADYKKSNFHKSIKKMYRENASMIKPPIAKYDDDVNALAAFNDNPVEFFETLDAAPLDHQKTMRNAYANIVNSKRYQSAIQNLKIRDRFPSQNLLSEYLAA